MSSVDALLYCDVLQYTIIQCLLLSSLSVQLLCSLQNLLTFDETLQTRLNLMQITLDLNCCGYLL